LTLSPACVAAASVRSRVVRGLAPFGFMISRPQYVFNPIALAHFKDPSEGSRVTHWPIGPKGRLAGGTTYLTQVSAQAGYRYNKRSRRDFWALHSLTVVRVVLS